MGLLAAREQTASPLCSPDTHYKTALSSPLAPRYHDTAQQHQQGATAAQIQEFHRTASMRRVAIALLALVGGAEAFVAPQPTAAPLTVVAGRADLCSNHEAHRRFIEALT